MKTEKQVIDSFLEHNSEYLKTEELAIYADSLDCALATILECERLKIDYPASYAKAIEAVTEKGEFWDACLSQARHDLGKLPSGVVFDNLYIEKAKLVGINILLEGFQEGL